MSKILRKTAVVFASNPGANQVAQYGSLAAAAKAYSTDPAVIQALSQWTTGWFGAVLGSNNFAIEDMNAFCYVMAYQIAYLMQAGISEWDSATTYYLNSMVNSNGLVYISIADDNINHAVSDPAWWVPQGLRITSITTTANISATDQYCRCDTALGSYTVTLPTIASSKNQSVTIKNVTNNLNTVTVAGNGSELIDFANTFDLGAGQSLSLFNNGTNWDIL